VTASFEGDKQFSLGNGDMPRRFAALSILTLLLFPVSTLAQDVPAHVRTGMLTPAATVNPLHQPVGQALSSAAQSRPKGARPIHPAHSTFAAVSQGPEGVATPFGANTSGKLLSNFNGVSSLDSAVTNFGAEFEPLDQGLCVGKGFVVEPVNSAFTIYRRNGSVVAGPRNAFTGTYTINGGCANGDQGTVTGRAVGVIRG
jgi:hypothetical protein